MEIARGTTSNSTLRGLLIALALLLAAIIAHALGVPIPGLSDAFNKIAEHKSASELTSRPDYASLSWYEGASEYSKANNQHQSLRVPLLIYFRTDWCPYCKKLDRDILPLDEVSRFMKSVVKVRINPEAGADEKALAERYGVKGYPSIFILPTNSDTPTKVYPFRKVGNTFVAATPSEFVTACQEAGISKTP